MIISAPRAIDTSLTLWPGLDNVKIKSFAATRNHCGDFIEELTAAATGAVRHRTDSRADICPDLVWREQAHFECKCVGRTGHSILYLKRVAKDGFFQKRHPDRPLFYWFWHHGADAESAVYRDDLRRDIAVTLRHCTVLPFEAVRDCARLRPVKVLNKALTAAGGHLGYGKGKWYGRGWSVRMNVLAELCNVTVPHSPLTVGDVTTVPFLIRTVSSALPFLLD